MEILKFIWFISYHFKFQIIKALGLPQYLCSSLLPLIKSFGLYLLTKFGQNTCTISKWFFHLTLNLLWFALLIIAISFIKSLKTRYYLASSCLVGSSSSSSSENRINQTNEQQKEGEGKIGLNDGQIVTKCNAEGQQRGIFSNDKFKEFLLLLKDKDRLIKYIERKVCSLLPGGRRNLCDLSAASDENISSIHRQLPWSDTQLEFESVNWINNSMRVLWPSIQSLVDKVLRTNLKQAAAATAGQQDKFKNGTMAKRLDRDKERKRPPKLAFFLSCRRKLNLLRKYKQLAYDIPLEKSAFQKTISLIVSMLKITLLHFKQFVVDQIMIHFVWNNNNNNRQAVDEQVNNTGKVVKREIIKVNMDKLLQKSKQIAIQQVVAAEAAAAVANSKLERVTNEQQHQHQRRLPTTSLTSSKLLQQQQQSNNSTYKKCQYLANKIDLAQKEMRERKAKARLGNGNANANNGSGKGATSKPITIVNLDLGDKPPEISAIKFIEHDNNLLLSDVLNDGTRRREIEPSDLSNKKILIELTFKSGEDFCVRLNSIPILDKIQLTKFKLTLRLLIRINRTNFNLDENLEVFERPDRVLYPPLNYIELSLVDVPKLDWHLESASKHIKGGYGKAKQLKNYFSPRIELRGRRNRKRSPLAQVARKSSPQHHKYVSPLVRLKKLFTPTKLINHSYFKYLIHLAIYLVQLWFRPFDIRLGEMIYIKSLI